MRMVSLNGEKIFITGGTGFVGSNLVRWALKQGAEVYTSVRRTSDTWRLHDILGDIALIPVDLENQRELVLFMKDIRPNIIFHTAVYGGNPAQFDLNKMLCSNIIGTANLIRSCRDIPFDLFVNTGSSSEYGIKESPMKESDILEPVTDYAVSKASSTLLCRSKALNDGLPIVTLRLFSPYGYYEGRSRLIPSVVLNALRKVSPVISSREFVRDFIFIEDVVDAYGSLLELKDPAGEIFNIGSGKEHTVGEVTDTIIKYLGDEVDYITGKPQAWKNEPAHWQADIEKAKYELGWTPHYSLEYGLRTTVDWFRSNLNLYQEGS